MSLCYSGSNPIKYGVSIVRGEGGGTHVAIPTAERRAFGFMIHALMLAVNIMIAKAAYYPEALYQLITIIFLSHLIPYPVQPRGTDLGTLVVLFQQ